MILTGRAKNDFLKWYFGKCIKQIELKQFSLDIAKAITYATFIEWLDSVKLTITIKYCIDTTFDSFLDIENKEEIRCSQFSETRSEATQQAIIKANEIYNNLNK